MQHSKPRKWRLDVLAIALSALDTTGFLLMFKLAIGKAADPYSDYFDRCRRKRNVIDYDDAFVATETEAKEILEKAKEFAQIVEKWIVKNHPSLKV